MTRRGAATRVYSLALRAFPRRHRVAYAAEMIDAFERELAARLRGPGTWRALGFVVAAWLNVASAGLDERRRQRRLGFTGATGFSWIDFILAWRMLVRYPGLTIVGVFGVAVGIAMAAGARSGSGRLWGRIETASSRASSRVLSASWRSARPPG